MHLLFILIVAGLIVLKLAGLAAISWWLFFGVALIPPLACDRALRRGPGEHRERHRFGA
jgi:hypothetical protein